MTLPQKTNCPSRQWIYCAVYASLMSLSILMPGSICAQIPGSRSLSIDSLKNLSLEELMNIEVSSVSKHPEKLSQAASAIQVITQNDIRRSGAKTIAEALRLAPNLQVAQVNSSQWAISARGFNNVLANKLLVLIDGRTVYTPMYAGVFWDVQNVLLEDVDRIEVISGPGGALWGANAVNGVINIITRNAKDTKGLFAEAAVGSSLPRLGSLRYGGRIKDKLSYRVYGTGFKMGDTIDTSGKKANDDWPVIQGGFRLDWEASKNDNVSLQGNIYHAKPRPDGDTSVSIIARGDNIVARWEHKQAETFGFGLQAYYDHTWRDFGNGFTEDLKTYDIDFHIRTRVSRWQTLTMGAGARIMDHTVTNLPLFAFLPGQQTLWLYSAFVQDEMNLVKERLHMTVGIKAEHNSYTGFEYQPDVRLNWTPATNQNIWAAVSRAVRTPARIDRDFFLYLIPNLPLISGSSTFDSEDMIAYELGWRWQPLARLSTSVAGFYNVYDNIRSAEPGPPPYNIPITFGNDVKGHTYGIELSANFQPCEWWNLRGGYTFLEKKLSVKPGSHDLNAASAESNDPAHQFLIQSNLDIARSVELGTVIRYTSKLPKPAVAAYTAVDMRIGWKLNRIIELHIVGQNLLDKQHREFIPSSPAPREIARSVYGKIICRL